MKHNSIWKKRSKKFLKVIANLQTVLLLSLFYYLVFGPVALLYKIGKIFSPKSLKVPTYWLEKEKITLSQEKLQKQY